MKLITGNLISLLLVLLSLLLVACGDEDELSSDEFLQRVEAELASQGEVSHVSGTTQLVDPQTQPLWTTEAWFLFSDDQARFEMRKDASNTIDIPDEMTWLRVGQDVFTSDQRYTLEEQPACFSGEPAFLVMQLVCGPVAYQSEPGVLRVEGTVDFEGREVRSLAVDLGENRIARLLVHPESYVPVAQTITQNVAGQSYQQRTLYTVEFVSRQSVADNFFEPSGIGYVSPAEEWLRILDDPALGVPIMWPGRMLSGTGPYDAMLSDVEDRQAPAGLKNDGPGHLLTLSYQGESGLFRLDYWEPGKFDEFVDRLGSGFAWASCSARRTVDGGPGEIVILEGFVPVNLMPPAPTLPGTPSPPLPELFPNGCPERAYDNFMTVVSFPDVVVTINAPYGIASQSHNAFGLYNTPIGLEAIARSLRLRQPGE